MVGIKDIAKQAGVAISTVSYALNGSPQVSEKTRQRIVEIAAEMGYVPNLAGQNLRKKRTHIIGVYLTNYQGNFYSEVLEGMLDTAKENGYDLITCSGKRSRLFLPQGLIDGALVLDTYFPDKEIIDYADRGKPLIVMDRKVSHEQVRQVLLDNGAGAESAVRMLLGAGLGVVSPGSVSCKEVWLITGPQDNFDSIERLAAAESVLKTAGMAYSIVEGDFTEGAGSRAMSEIMSGVGALSNSSYPIGVFALNDEMALGVYSYLQGTNYRLGEDIYLVGFDGIRVTQFTSPTIATVSYSERDWGRIAVETLIGLLDGEKPKDSRLPMIPQAGESVPGSLLGNYWC